MLIEAAKGNRYGHCDATMILLTYRHGFRDLRPWLGRDRLKDGTMHVSRKKHGQSTTHQIGGDELRALRRLQREQEPKSVFVTRSRTIQ